MSLTVETYPVYTDGIKTINIFSGFNPVNIVMSRQDLVIDTISQGANNTIDVNISTDITSELVAGDFIYIYSEGVDYTYSLTAKVLSVSATVINLDSDYIESATGGYTNYKQNYTVEMKLVNPDNSDIDMLGFTLKQAGSAAGSITFDVSIINDLNSQNFTEQLTGREVTEGRIKFNVKYREIWREDATATFTLIDNPIIVAFSTRELIPEEFSNPFTEPPLYLGYPMGIGFIHTDANYPGEAIKFTFDELDINKNAISTDKKLKQFEIGDYGILTTTTEDNDEPLSPNTKYLRLYAQNSNIPEYEPTEYSSEYNIY